MARSGFRIIDAHHHVGRLSSFIVNPGGAGSGPTGPTTEEDIAFRLEVMDHNGMDRSVVIPGHDYLRPEGQADTCRINDGIAAYRDARPDRFAAAVGIVEPLHGDASLDELVRIKEQLGLVGVSFHARFQGAGMDSPLVRRLVERMGELRLVPFMHAINESEDEAPWKIAQVAAAVPDLPVLVLDGFSGFERSKQLAVAAEVAPNLLFDTSLAYSFGLVEALAARIGHERLVFGTDLYSPPVGYRHSYVLDQLLAGGLSDEAKRAILWDNLHRALGLDGGAA